MAIYRFRVTFEDYEDVYREIDMLSKHTFLDLHKAIHASTGYDPEKSSSFYVSNDHWKKGEEIAYLPDSRKIDQGVLLMENVKLSKFINDPHQKFYYIYDFLKSFDFHVQLIKILKEEEGVEYPVLFKSVGTPPRLTIIPNIQPEDDDSEDDEENNAFSFEAELDYGDDDENGDDMEIEDDESEGESDLGFEEEY